MAMFLHARLCRMYEVLEPQRPACGVKYLAARTPTFGPVCHRTHLEANDFLNS
jgi:hypothetical protein